MKSKDIPENQEVSLHGFNHISTDKIDNYILIACESKKIYENDNNFNSSSHTFSNTDIEMRNFKITQWYFMTVVKRNNFLKN